jgi:hypothetical protein
MSIDSARRADWGPCRPPRLGRYPLLIIDEVGYRPFVGMTRRVLGIVAMLEDFRS